MGSSHSRFYFQRLFRAQTGETPGDCRRRLRLERAAYQLRHAALGSLRLPLTLVMNRWKASRAPFGAAYGVSPSHYRRLEPFSWFLPAPNDIHYDPPDTQDNSATALLQRMAAAFGEFRALVQRVQAENLWDSEFVDMICEPPERFTYGGMIAHVITFAAYRRTVALQALSRLGVTDLGYGDPIEWEMRERG